MRFFIPLGSPFISFYDLYTYGTNSPLVPLISLVCTSHKILTIYLKTQVGISDNPVSKKELRFIFVKPFLMQFSYGRFIINSYLIIISVRISFQAFNPILKINYSASPPALYCCIELSSIGLTHLSA